VKYGNRRPKGSNFAILKNRSVAHFENVPHLLGFMQKNIFPNTSTGRHLKRYLGE